MPQVQGVFSDLLQAMASHPASPGCFLGILHVLSRVAGLTERYSFDICDHKVSGKRKNNAERWLLQAASPCSEFRC